MLAKRLISTIALEKSVWLDYRRKGISGSDIGAICSISKWKSPVSVYLEKIGELPDEQEDNEFMYWGRTLEALIADEFKKRNTSFKVKRINAILQHPEYEWALGNVDREIVNDKGERGILEIKTVSEYGKDEWKENHIPENYLLQLQWYLFVTGYKYGFFAALVGGNKYIQKYVERDDELIAYIFDIAKDFWSKVQNHCPPQIDGSEASCDVLKALYKISDPTAPTMQLTSDFDLLLSQREDIKNQISDLETSLNEIDNKIKAELKECEAAETNLFKITWKASKGRETFDTKTFKKDNPDLAAKYLKVGEPSRTFKVSRKEG